MATTTAQAASGMRSPSSSAANSTNEISGVPNTSPASATSPGTTLLRRAWMTGMSA
jgi:hypothetical protein